MGFRGTARSCKVGLVQTYLYPPNTGQFGGSRLVLLLCDYGPFFFFFFGPGLRTSNWRKYCQVLVRCRTRRSSLRPRRRCLVLIHSREIANLKEHGKSILRAREIRQNRNGFRGIRRTLAISPSPCPRFMLRHALWNGHLVVGKGAF